MKLKSLTIENFRCYKEQQSITFNTDGKITLIYGGSGHGKSTLLQFINWMFYDAEPRSKETKKNKPIYNESYAVELPVGKKMYVRGTVDFSHLGVDYQLNRQYVYEKKLYDFIKIDSSFILNYKNKNGSWVEYTGKINDKINEIVPVALSKYFFFSGESNVIADAGNELKDSIYNLFGLTKYENALTHLGERANGLSLISNYTKKKNETKPDGAKAEASYYYQEMIKYKTISSEFDKKIIQLDKKIDNLDEMILQQSRMLATLPDTNQEKRKVAENENSIRLHEKNIKIRKGTIGNILYKSIPYLILYNSAKITRSILAESAKEEKTYADLKKTTLEDIIKQGICVCGHKIDLEAEKHINKILSSMPPNSFNYIYTEFDKNLEYYYNLSIKEYGNLENLLGDMVECKNQINKLHEENDEILEKLKKSDDSIVQKISSDIQQYKREKEKFQRERDESVGKRDIAKKLFAQNAKAYEKVDAYEKSKGEYELRLELLNLTKKEIEQKFEERKKQTREELEKSIIEVYNRISTRIENFGSKKFLKDDFSLREEYKTGGQELVDVYSYIIGMIKAIHFVNKQENEQNGDFPVIIDAPFSKTDENQLKHIVDVIPEIVPQVAMFTFDVYRIKEFADLNKFGDLWIIHTNDEQTVSKISKGRWEDINVRGDE